MSGIDKMSNTIKKKISLMDHKPESPFNVDTSKHLEVKTGKQGKGNSLTDVNTSKHQGAVNDEGFEVDPSKHNEVLELKSVIKTTVYFKEDTKRKFDEIYAKRILANCKTDKSVLICEAIDLLYEKEHGQYKD